MTGRSPHGERGLKYLLETARTIRKGRSPHGERGLKWIQRNRNIYENYGRSPHGERGLKLGVTEGHTSRSGRSPHGERGLKCKHFRTRLPPMPVALLMESVD